MSTKAEKFRSETQRAARKTRTGNQTNLSSGPSRRSKGQLPPNETDSERSLGAKEPGTRTEKKAIVKVEASSTGDTSRKSTRASANRAKPDSNLSRRQTRRASSADTRAAKAEAKRATRAGARKV